MRKQSGLSFKNAMLTVATAVAAVGALMVVPMKKALAAKPQMGPGPMVNPPAESREIIQPRFVSPSAVKLLKIADEALSNPQLAERIFHEPDAVAQQYQLSPAERQVLRHMDPGQFEVARADASRLVASRMSLRRPMPAGATDARTITQRMIVGRAILAAVGRSYREAASANACCPWSKAIEVGVGGDPAAYNAGFARPAGGL